MTMQYCPVAVYFTPAYVNRLCDSTPWVLKVFRQATRPSLTHVHANTRTGVFMPCVSYNVKPCFGVTCRFHFQGRI